MADFTVGVLSDCHPANKIEITAIIPAAITNTFIVLLPIAALVHIVRGVEAARDRYDPTDDVYHCPGGKRLGTSGTVHEGKTLLYRASKLDCDVCPLKPQCCPKDPSRKIPRDIHEHARDVARSLADTEAYEQSRRERKKIEMRFAHLKRI